MNKHIYKCGICGSEHELPIERAKCELACAEKKAEEERKAAERKKVAEYAARKAEVDNAFHTANELKNKFVKDYGTYTYDLESNIFSVQPSLWRLFL